MTRDLIARAPDRLGLLRICAAGILWGSGGLVVTVLHQRDGLSAITASAWRMVLAAIALLAFAAVTGRMRIILSTFRRNPIVTTFVGCGTAVYQALYFGSVLAIGVSVATVVALGLAPVLAAAWEHLTARTRPPRQQVAVFAGALTGLVLVSVSSHPESSTTGGDPTIGLLLAVSAGVTYAATTILGHAYAHRIDTLALTTCATTAGAVLLATLLGVALWTHQPVLVTDAGSVALLVYLGVFTLALSYWLLYAGLRTTPSSAATVATLVEPISAAALATVLLGERLTWPTLVGGLLILGAVAGLTSTHRDQPRFPGRD